MSLAGLTALHVADLALQRRAAGLAFLICLGVGGGHGGGKVGGAVGAEDAGGEEFPDGIEHNGLADGGLAGWPG